MKLATVILDLMQRMATIAAFPLQMIIHPIDSTIKVLNALKPTQFSVSPNLQENTSHPPVPIESIEPETNIRTDATVKKRFSISDVGSTLLRNCYSFVTRPIKAFIFNYGAVKDAEGNSDSFNIIAFVTNFVHQLVLLLFAPTTHKSSHVSSIQTNHTNHSFESDETDTVNNDINYENQYNHKTEYLTKLDQEKREIVSETSSERHSINENTVAQVESISDSTTAINDSKENINGNIKVCNVCGFESQDSSITTASVRNNFEHQRGEYKSQIDLLLKKIRDVECEEVKTSNACASKESRRIRRNQNNIAESENSD